MTERIDSIIVKLAKENVRLIAEIERLREEMNARDPVDAMDRGMSPVEAAVYHVWGERCSDFEPGCTTCKAWAEFDQIERLRAVLWDIHAVCNGRPFVSWVHHRVKKMARAALAKEGE